MHYIKCFFEGGVPDWLHERFIRYGRGSFPGPKIKVDVKKDLKVTATVEYTNALAELIAKNTNDVINVSGMVFAKRDIGNVLADFFTIGKSKFAKGVFSADVKGGISGGEFTGLCGMIPDAMLLADVTSGRQKLKCKKKKLPKPGSKQNEAFCSATISASALTGLKDDLLFDAAGDFTTAEVSHEIVIDELIKPEGVTDPARLRKESKRKGRIKRTLTLDGKTSETEADLLV